MNRREFIKTGAAVAAGAAAVGGCATAAAVSGKRIVKVGVVGCGGRGTGAVKNILEAAEWLRKENIDVEVKIVACADFFRDKALKLAQANNVPESAVYEGASGYRQVMASDADVVLLVTPLNFRPVHFSAAIAAGKHVFAEKGVAVDPAGVRLFIDTARKATEKRLTVVAGTQRRHQRGYRLIAEAIRSGRVSPVLGGEVYWNGKVPWVRERKPGMSNKAYLCNNWLNFTELSGDHICEQHVHNIDVANWYIGRYPRTAVGIGGRLRRVSGNQYDCFSIDFDYGDGVHIHSMCRQITGCKNDVREFFRTKDSVISSGMSVKTLDGKKLELEGDFRDGNPYVVEHVDLLLSVLGLGPYWNEGEQVAMSTACGIMGRIAAYTGQIVTLNDIIKNESSPFYTMDAKPSALDFERPGDIEMPELGDDEFPKPGKPWEAKS